MLGKGQLRQFAIKIWPLSVLYKRIIGLEESVSHLQNELDKKRNNILSLRNEINAKSHIEEDLNKFITQLKHEITAKSCIEKDLNKFITQLKDEVTAKNGIEEELNKYTAKLEYEINAKSRIEEDLNSYIIQQQKRFKDIQEEKVQLMHQLEIQKVQEVKIESAKYWDDRYRLGNNSGMGSYNALAEFKAQVVNNFLNENRIETAIELGCGDGNQLSLIRYKIYTGVDVSSYIVDKNKERFSQDSSKQFYCSLTERNKYIHNKYDVSISMDVIFHLLEDEVYASYMDDLFSLSSKYVIIYSSNHEEFTKWPEYRHRKFMGYVQKHITGWELEQFIPNKYPYVIGHESETSASDFYIFKKQP